MATDVPSLPLPSSKGLCICVLFRLGKGVLLQKNVSFIGSAAIGARFCTSRAFACSNGCAVNERPARAAHIRTTKLPRMARLMSQIVRKASRDSAKSCASGLA